MYVVRALERVHAVLSFLSRYVQSLYPLTENTDTSTEGRATRTRRKDLKTKLESYVLWVKGFNHLLSKVQAAMELREYGSLPVEKIELPDRLDSLLEKFWIHAF